MTEGFVTVTTIPATRRDLGAVEEARWTVKQGTFRLVHHTTDVLIAERKLDGEDPRELALKLLRNWTLRARKQSYAGRPLPYPDDSWMA